jgi:hypothetical protein
MPVYGRWGEICPFFKYGSIAVNKTLGNGIGDEGIERVMFFGKNDVPPPLSGVQKTEFRCCRLARAPVLMSRIAKSLSVSSSDERLTCTGPPHPVPQRRDNCRCASSRAEVLVGLVCGNRTIEPAEQPRALKAQWLFCSSCCDGSGSETSPLKENYPVTRRTLPMKFATIRFSAPPEIFDAVHQRASLRGGKGLSVYA